MTECKLLKTGDIVIIIQKGHDYGKMCKIIEASTTNNEVPVRIQLVNQHDSFKFDDFGTHVAEKWIARANLKLYSE